MIMNHTHMSPFIPVLIMFIASFVLGYFINETISIRKNRTSNAMKLYMSLLMAFQMAMIELLMFYYFNKQFSNSILFSFLLVGILFSGYQLWSLNFLNKRQFLLSMIEHHENAVVMAKKLYNKTDDKQFNDLLKRIIDGQEDEIHTMYHLLL